MPPVRPGSGAVPRLVDVPPYVAAVVDGHKVSAASPRPAHATAGTGESAGTGGAGGTFRGPPAAEAQEVGPGGRGFDKGRGEPLPVDIRYGVVVCMAEKARVESTIGGQVRVFAWSYSRRLGVPATA